MPNDLRFSTRIAPRRIPLLAVALTACVFSCTHLAHAFDELALVVDAPAVVLEGVPGANAVEQQFRAQFEPLLKVELSFVNRTCKLSDEERRSLIATSNAWLTEFIKDYAKGGGQPQMRGMWFGGGQQQRATEPRESIQAGVEKLVKAELPQQKSAAYLEECKKRSEFVKSVAVENLVARIDKELILSPEQREKIAKSLTEHWDKSWAPQMEMFMHGMEVWPNVPDQWIRPHLSATQQVVWGRVPKQDSNHVFFGGMDGNAGVIDDIDLDEGIDKKKGLDVKPQPVAEAPQAAN